MAPSQRSQRPPRTQYATTNARIVEAAGQGNLEHFIAVVDQHLPAMNLVNLATAVHRLAKVAAACGQPASASGLPRHAVVCKLQEELQARLEGATHREAHAQSLSNVAWGLATLHLAPEGLWRLIATLSVRSAANFKPFELAMLMWAFAKVSCDCKVPVAVVKPVFEAFACHVAGATERFSFRSLATISWAFATARQHDARLFVVLAAGMRASVAEANPQELANSAWAFATAKVHDPGLFTRLADAAHPRLDQFKAQEVSNILWAFASNKFFHKEFYLRVAATVGRMEGLRFQHLTTVICAFAGMCPRQPMARSAILGVLPRLAARLDEASARPQEVCVALLSVAKFFNRGDAAKRVPAEVGAFFAGAVAWLSVRAGGLSVQSLCNIVCAQAMVCAPGGEGLLRVAQGEVSERLHDLESAAMWPLLRAFSMCAEPEWPDAGGVVQALAGRLAERVLVCSDRELQALAADSPMDAWSSREDLREFFLSVAVSKGAESPESSDVPQAQPHASYGAEAGSADCRTTSGARFEQPSWCVGDTAQAFMLLGQPDFSPAPVRSDIDGQTVAAPCHNQAGGVACAPIGEGYAVFHVVGAFCDMSGRPLVPPAPLAPSSSPPASGPPTPALAAGAAGKCKPDGQWRCSVKNSFIHVEPFEDASTVDSDGDSSTATPRRALSAPGSCAASPRGPRGLRA
uniref:RNA-editing substrate-binding complex 6 protein domain-containing protein n=1 Tax=Zooxanthella nutricula TaxID=1333877 RepID=A0A6U6UKG7_9DINO